MAAAPCCGANMLPDVAKAAVKPEVAVAFHPGYESNLKRGFEPRTKVPMVAGEADDWSAC